MFIGWMHNVPVTCKVDLRGISVWIIVCAVKMRVTDQSKLLPHILDIVTIY